MTSGEARAVGWGLADVFGGVSLLAGLVLLLGACGWVVADAPTEAELPLLAVFGVVLWAGGFGLVTRGRPSGHIHARLGLGLAALVVVLGCLGLCAGLI